MTAKKQGDSSVQHLDDAQLEHLLEQRHSIAKELHNSTSKAQAERALVELTSIDEAPQMALLKAMAKLQDTDSADVLLAINELTPNKAIRKEARREQYRSEEHTSELQSHSDLVCRLLLEKK